MNIYPLTLTEDLDAASHFYKELFGFAVIADVGWYVQLGHPDNPQMQLAFMDRNHDSLPAAFQADATGVVITIEVDSADALFDRATRLQLPLHTEVQDEEWGQRHFVTQDPAGLLVDVVQPIPPSREFLAKHGLTDTGAA